MKLKIVIAGLGGVGGYFGGLLAKHFYNSQDVEIFFFARGKHLEEIRQNGLKVIKGDDIFVAKPTLATDNVSEIGIADYIIIATKSYDLEFLIQQMKPCINQDTIILPLLNGVDSRERIISLLPSNIVLKGCVYLVARLKQAGVIENLGNLQTLYFGIDNVENDRFYLLEKLFKEANIDATLSKNISSIIWEKFIFISPTATSTSYFNKCIGELVADNKMLNFTLNLIEEIKQIAIAKQISIPENIIEKTLNKLKALPFEATSSMHSDFKNFKLNTELKSLTGYVIEQGVKYNIETPTYNIAFDELELKRAYD